MTRAVLAAGVALIVAVGSGGGGAQAAVAPVTAAQMQSVTLPADHPCEYLGAAFNGPVSLKAGALRATGSKNWIKLDRVLLTDANGDAVKDGVVTVRCYNKPAITRDALLVKYAGRTGPATAVPLWDDVLTQQPGLRVGKVLGMQVVVQGVRRLRVTSEAYLSTDPAGSPSARVRVVYDLGARAPSLLSVTRL